MILHSCKNLSITLNFLLPNTRVKLHIMATIHLTFLWYNIFFLFYYSQPKNRDLYESNSEIRNINTRFSSDLHTPTANLTTFQIGPFYFGIKVFTHLPTSSRNTSIKQLRSVLKSFLLINSFYSEEYFTRNSNRDPGSVWSF
jgi:hypothetical protein